MKETRAFKKEISEVALRQKEKHFEGTFRPQLLQVHGYETEDSELGDLGLLLTLSCLWELFPRVSHSGLRGNSSEVHWNSGRQFYHPYNACFANMQIHEL